MSEYFLGEMRIFGFGFAPKGWAMCNGQTLSIAQNQALFSLLGTYYGGNGIQTFGLPNFQGRLPIGFGFPQGGGSYNLGDTGGENSHTLIAAEMPAHIHSLAGSPAAATTDSPLNNILATGSGVDPYAPPPGNTTMAAGELGAAGGGQPHENRQPFLVLNVCIALQGIYPSRS